MDKNSLSKSCKLKEKNQSYKKQEIILGCENRICKKFKVGKILKASKNFFFVKCLMKSFAHFLLGFLLFISNQEIQIKPTLDYITLPVE